MAYFYRVFRSGSPSSSVSKEIEERRPLSHHVLRKTFTFDLGLSLVDETRFAAERALNLGNSSLAAAVIEDKDGVFALRFEEKDFFSAIKKNNYLNQLFGIFRPALADSKPGFHAQICRATDHGFNLETQLHIFQTLLTLPSSTFIVQDKNGNWQTSLAASFKYVP